MRPLQVGDGQGAASGGGDVHAADDTQPPGLQVGDGRGAASGGGDVHAADDTFPLGLQGGDGGDEDRAQGQRCESIRLGSCTQPRKKAASANKCFIQDNNAAHKDKSIVVHAFVRAQTIHKVA